MQENLCGTTIRDLMLVYPFKVCLRYWTDLLVKALLNGKESPSAAEWEFEDQQEDVGGGGIKEGSRWRHKKVPQSPPSSSPQPNG